MPKLIKTKTWKIQNKPAIYLRLTIRFKLEKILQHKITLLVMLHVLSFGRNVENMSSLDTDKVCYLDTNM